MCPFVYYFKIVYFSKTTFCARAVIESISRVHRVNIEPLSRVITIRYGEYWLDYICLWPPVAQPEHLPAQRITG